MRIIYDVDTRKFKADQTTSHSFSAYSVFCCGVSADTPGTVVDLSELHQILQRDPYPPESVAQLLELLPEMPGVPLGLTFDGGIAVTATDYRLAESRWKKEQEGPGPA